MKQTDGRELTQQNKEEKIKNEIHLMSHSSLNTMALRLPKKKNIKSAKEK